MGRTVSNHTKVVCNIGSNHTAFTDKDICKLPKEDAYDNSAYSANLQAKRSLKTTISKHPIALKDMHWTPSVSPGTVGVSTGGVLMEAWVDVGSPDLIIENKPAGRVYDSTMQNHGNSKGEVKPGKIQPRKDGATERAKKKCTLHKWGAKAHGGAELGWRADKKTATPNYLDVWDTDTLDFWCVRHDISRTPPREGVKCEVPVEAVIMVDGEKTTKQEYHTIWDATASVFPTFMRKETIHESGTDKFSFPAKMALEKWLSGSVMKNLTQGNFADAAAALLGESASKFMTNDGSDRMEDFDPSNAEETAGRFKQGQGQGLGRQNYGGINNPSTASGLIRNPDQKLVRLPDKAQGAPLKPAWEMQDDQRRKQEKKPKSVGFKHDVDIRTLIFYATWMLFPPEIKVTAQACSGQREATIRVLPNQRLEFAVTLPAGDRFKKWAQDKERKKQKAADQADDDVKKATEEAAAADQAQQAAKAAENQARAQQAAALDRLQAAGAKRDSIGGDTGANRKGRERQEKKMDKAYDKWRESGAEAHKQLGEFRATMAKYATAAEHLNKCITAAANMQKGLNVCQKIAAVAKQPLVFKFLENFELTVIVEYMRTPEGWGGQKWNYYTNAMMGRKWTFKFGTTPLIGIDWTVYFSLLNLVAGYLPGVVGFLRWLGIRVDLYFRISFKIPVALTVTKTQNDKFKGGVEVGVKAAPELGVIVGTGIDVVQVSATVPTELKASFSAPKEKGSLATVSPKFFVTNHIRVVFFPQRRWSIEAISKTFQGLTYTFNQDSRYKYQFGSLPS